VSGKSFKIYHMAAAAATAAVAGSGKL